MLISRHIKLNKERKTKMVQIRRRLGNHQLSVMEEDWETIGEDDGSSIFVPSGRGCDGRGGGYAEGGGVLRGGVCCEM